MLAEFVDHVVSFIDTKSLRNLKIVADTANGMGGLVAPAVFERLSKIELEVMYGELMVLFRTIQPTRFSRANQRDLQARVISGKFDVGLAFDGDADRVFLVDELGKASRAARRQRYWHRYFCARIQGRQFFIT